MEEIKRFVKLIDVPMPTVRNIDKSWLDILYHTNVVISPMAIENTLNVMLAIDSKVPMPIRPGVTIVVNPNSCHVKRLQSYDDLKKITHVLPKYDIGEFFHKIFSCIPFKVYYPLDIFNSIDYMTVNVQQLSCDFFTTFDTKLNVSNRWLYENEAVYMRKLKSKFGYLQTNKFRVLEGPCIRYYCFLRR
jgi:hypothetical protein